MDLDLEVEDSDEEDLHEDVSVEEKGDHLEEIVVKEILDHMFHQF